VNESPLTPVPAASNDTLPENLDGEEETLVADQRSSLSPSQQVEQKLLDSLGNSPLRVSQVQRQLKPGSR
jgi:hypothetical protein